MAIFRVEIEVAREGGRSHFAQILPVMGELLHRRYELLVAVVDDSATRPRDDFGAAARPGTDD